MSEDIRPALIDFLSQRYGDLKRRLTHVLGSDDLAGDALQDTWLRLGDMEIGATVHSPEAYVYRVACNIAMDRLRGNRA